MHSGAGGFSGSIEARQVGASMKVGADATHHIVGRGTDRHLVYRDVHVVLETGLINTREAGLDMLGLQMG